MASNRNDNGSSKIREENTETRSMLKGISWRFLATAVTTMLSFFLTGTIATALKIGPTDFVVKFVIYYLHERLWLVPSFQRLPSKKFWKMCLWKVIAISLTMCTTVYVTGRFDLAMKLGPADFFLKLFLYYAHELVWDNISYGRRFVKDAETKTE